MFIFEIILQLTKQVPAVNTRKSARGAYFIFCNEKPGCFFHSLESSPQDNICLFFK